MRGVFAAIGLATVIVAACTAYDEASPAPGPASDASDASDASGDAAADALPEASGAGDGSVPPRMVVVETAAARYAIDATEVTVKEWKAFRDTRPFDVGAFPPECAHKTGFGPRTGTCPYDDIDALPIHCIDWCDAYAYCTAVGKRLCGKIGAGKVPRSDQVNPSASQWTRACANGLDADRWSYGTAFKPSTCNSETFDGGPDAGNLLPSGSLPGCVGGVPGLFDMSGNAWEWEDATCLTSDAGTNNDECRIRGGAFTSGDFSTKCNIVYPKERGDVARSVSFRCCKDL